MVYGAALERQLVARPREFESLTLRQFVYLCLLVLRPYGKLSLQGRV